MHNWPAIRTQNPGHRGFEIGHAASIGLVAILIGLPLLGLGASSLLQPPPFASATEGSIPYVIAQMIAYSPLVSWLGLVFGVPLVHWAIKSGYGGWTVTVLIGTITGGLVLSICVYLFMDIASFRIALLGSLFGAVYAGIYWLVMRLMSPGLFRTTPD